jgi:hypothetical protein
MRRWGERNIHDPQGREGLFVLSGIVAVWTISGPR